MLFRANFVEISNYFKIGFQLSLMAWASSECPFDENSYLPRNPSFLTG